MLLSCLCPLFLFRFAGIAFNVNKSETGDNVWLYGY